MSDLKTLFDKIVGLVKETPVTPQLEVSNEDKLRMYGLYKQASGVCNVDDAPSVWKVVQRAKYESWSSYRDLTPNEAMLRYVRVAARQPHWLGHKCKDLVEAYQTSIVAADGSSSSSSIIKEVKHDEGDKTSGEGERSTSTRGETTSSVALEPTGNQSLSVAVVQHEPQQHLMERLFGLKPVVPRGQLDISYRHLATAARFCLEFSSSPKRDACEHKITSIWKKELPSAGSEQEILVGLSARSLLDLYLRSKALPAGSEVIIVPPINIPAMVAILEYHQLTIVPIDLPESFGDDQILRIDMAALTNAITSKTAGVMVVHPFGIETATEMDMKELRVLADKYNFDIIEDCAECYTGTSSMIRPHSDLALFSFGTIKTATALGGGVALFGHKGLQLVKKMRRLHQSLYEPQTQSEFFWKVFKAFFIRLISDFPIYYGIIVAACQWVGLDFDRMVSSSTRSFPPNRLQGSGDLIHMIRRRPSLALLSTLHVRLRDRTLTESITKDKVQRCERMMTMLKDRSADLCWPLAAEKHAWWLAPIVVPNPDETSRRLLHQGFDVPRGLSQLQCIETESQVCPRAQAMMDSLLYLPLASRVMSQPDMLRLAQAISAATAATSSNNERTTKALSWQGKSVLAIIVALFSMLWRMQAISEVISLLVDILQIGLSLILTKLLFDCLLTYSMAGVYLDSSDYFAKYNPMLRQMLERDQKADQGGLCLESIQTLRMTALPVTESKHKPSVLLTGATGFLGSSILRCLLANYEVLSSVDRIVLICRTKREKSASRRINDLLDQDIFSFLSKEDRENKILVLEGDVSKRNSGLNAKAIACLCSDMTIQSVINCAASVGFTQTLDEAAASNITSALYLQKLSQTLNAKFVHISTAFVHGGLTGSKASPLGESLFSLGSLDASKVYRSMTGNQMYASRAMSALGFPNTYTLSKCICEHLLLQSAPDDVIIVRPAIIGPAVQEPFEGWAGQKPSTIVAATCLYMKFPWTIWCFGKDKAAVIPVDVVARFVLNKALSGDIASANDRIESSSECSSPGSSQFEKVAAIAEVESLSSDNCSDDAESSTRAESSASRIYTAAWNASSPEISSFSYFDFATSVPHLGTVLGSFSRCTAYISFAVSVRILPSMELTNKSFAFLYHLLVQLPFSALVRVVAIAGQTEVHQNLMKLSSFLDLPVLFYPFVNNAFVFESELKAPETLDGKRYMFSCVAAAHRFLYDFSLSGSTDKKGNNLLRDTSNVIVGGRDHHLLSSDLWWALTQPCGNIFVRLVGYLLVKLLRASCTAVSVDVESFAEISRHVKEDNRVVHIVLAPTHRSFYDFLLVSFIAFSIPELKVQIPNIAAADDFANLPLLGWFMGYLHAFFVKRGSGIDPKLAKRVMSLKAKSKGHGACIEVFIEGSRSRDRRFLEAKTGFLRCLEETGGDHLIVPICISYEKIPEQGGLAREGASGKKRGLRTTGLLPWLWETFKGRLPIGSIHIAAAKPIALKEHAEINFAKLVGDIQHSQRALVCVSSYHVQAAADALHLDEAMITEALQQLGCTFWPTESGAKLSRAPAPSSTSEAWSVTMQFSHLIAPKLKKSHAFWSDWLCAVKTSTTHARPVSKSALALVVAFEELFDRAMAMVDGSIEELKSVDLCQLSVDHVVQIAKSQPSPYPVPDTVLIAYASMRIDQDDQPVKRLSMPSELTHLDVENEFEELGMWGFKDSRFQVHPDKKGNASVVMAGTRYGISGKSLTKLIPFIEAETMINIDIYQDPPLEVVGFDVADCSLSTSQVEEVRSIVSRLSVLSATRARHGTGHSQADAYQLRSAESIRVPDLVVWPATELEVENLVKSAQENCWNLIPHGGGTNVSQATKCPAQETDPRPIISVDMTDMKSILWVNEEDGLAHVQAGITGRELVEEMARRGYTIGHEPDSLEFSTLGGWIATKASGMKRSKYGNIEDIVVDIRVAASKGSFWQGSNEREPTPVGRQSRGPDLLSLFLGSEGCLGIITSAVTRIWPLPPVQDYESVLLRDFDNGVQFAHNASKLGPFLPASVRLLDNAHFRLGQAMREEMSIVEKAAKSAFTLLSPALQCMSSHDMVCATVLFEGTQEEVQEQRRHIKKLAAQYGGILLGPRIGRSGYDLTFVIAYLRDFALSYNFLGESFETFAPWSKLQNIVSATKQRIKEEHTKRRLPGEVFVGCRVTQLYHSGACLYFYLCMYCGNVDDANGVFSEIEHCARQEILNQGGSLSHHHGIGKLRADFVRDMDSKALREGLLAVKDGLDPLNTFGARNGIFGSAP